MEEVDINYEYKNINYEHLEEGMVVVSRLGNFFESFNSSYGIYLKRIYKESGQIKEMIAPAKYLKSNWDHFGYWILGYNNPMLFNSVYSKSQL